MAKKPEHVRYHCACDNSRRENYITTRDSNMENAKALAELVDDKLARHYELDDSGKKKVRPNCVLKG